MDVTRLHHSPERSDAANLGLRDAGRCGVFGYIEGWGEKAQAGQFGPDCIFIYMTGMSELAWKAAADAGSHVSLSTPIEIQMRHGVPPIHQRLDLGMLPSLSSDVECTIAADPFIQMRSTVTLQRMFANDLALNGQGYPRLMSAMDVIEMATIGGAQGLKPDHRTGSLTSGKEADIMLLDATALNVAPW